MTTQEGSVLDYSAQLSKTRLTIVVPCKNEEKSLPSLIVALKPVLERCAGKDWNVLLIDDGSTDHTAEVAAQLHEADRRVGLIRLSRNYGHQAALTAGLGFVHADYVAIIDADLQDPPEIMEQLFQKVAFDGYDLCYGVRRRREAPFLLNLSYRLFYRIMQTLSEHEWPLDAGDFSVFNRRVHLALLRMPEYDRMLRGLRSWVGFKSAALPYHRPARSQGRSKYNIWRLGDLAISAIVGFSTVPLRLASLVGFGMSVFTLFVSFLFLANRLVPGFTPFGYYVGLNPGTTTIVLYGSLVSCMLFFCIGILGEYLAVLVREVKKRPCAIIAYHTDGLVLRGDAQNLSVIAP